MMDERISPVINLAQDQQLDIAYLAQLWKKQVDLMNRKLDKKNELIKYLERKCGRQVIQITERLLERIKDLELEN